MTRSDLPTSSLNRSTHLAFGAPTDSSEGRSPIAADGGFGPMAYDNESPEHTESVDAVEGPEVDDGFGEDFDDFEAEAGDDDFGDFDEGFQQPVESEVPLSSKPTVTMTESPFVSSESLPY